MISANIEKEIQQKNKIILGLTFRQLLISLGCIVIAIILGMVLSFQIAIYPDAVIAVIAFFFGWFERDGLNAERYLLKMLQEKFYHNGKRKYRTRNKYITLLNQEYQRRKNIDLADKATKKVIAREEKANKKRIRTTTMKSVQ